MYLYIQYAPPAMIAIPTAIPIQFPLINRNIFPSLVTIASVSATIPVLITPTVSVTILPSQRIQVIQIDYIFFQTALIQLQLNQQKYEKFSFLSCFNFENINYFFYFYILLQSDLMNFSKNIQPRYSHGNPIETSPRKINVPNANHQININTNAILVECTKKQIQQNFYYSSNYIIFINVKQLESSLYYYQIWLLNINLKIMTNYQVFQLVLCFLLSLSHSKLILQSQSNIIGIVGNVNEENILADPLVEVIGTSKHFNIEEYELTYLKFSEVGKRKRKTYESFRKKYNKIIKCLVKNQIIPQENAMIHTGLQKNFLNKKRMWEFSRVFVVYSDTNQLTKVLDNLEQFKLTKWKKGLVMGYLNQKLIAIKAFTAAKGKLQKFLKKKLNSKIEIGHVVDIQIQGKKLVNEQDIQEELIKEYNLSQFSEQLQVEVINDSKNKHKKHKEKDWEAFDEDITIKVLFKLREKTDESKNLQDHKNQRNSRQSDKSELDSVLDEEDEDSPDDEDGDEQL